MAIVQAIDYLKIQTNLSTRIHEVYNNVRTFFPVFTEDTPKYKDIANVINYLKKNISI